MSAMLAVSTPALADHRRFDPRWGVDHGGRQHPGTWRGHRDRGVSTEGAIIIGLGALLVGKAIADSNNRRREREVIIVERYPQQPRQVCQDVVQHDYYGNPYVAGRNCWYER